jgi:hypothetical protein
MANVVKWGYNIQFIVFNPKLKKDVWRMPDDHTIYVETAILDADVQCMHCGKTVKSGKLVFVFYDASVCISPSSMSKEGWGDERSKLTFCSSSHAKLFAKNTK